MKPELDEVTAFCERCGIKHKIKEGVLFYKKDSNKVGRLCNPCYEQVKPKKESEHEA